MMTIIILMMMMIMMMMMNLLSGTKVIKEGKSRKQTL